MSRKSTAAKFAGEGYTISVIGRHVAVTDAMKDYVVEKVTKIEKYHNRILEVIVTMDVQKLQHFIDIVVKVNSTRIKSHAVTEDMYASIDLAVDKLERQLRDYKDRLSDHQAKSSGVIDMNVNVFRTPEREMLDEVNDQIDEANLDKLEDSYRPHKVVNQEKWPLKTLNYEEALWHMELSGEPFLIYRCEEDQLLKVLYRRNDDNFGVVEIVT